MTSTTTPEKPGAFVTPGFCCVEVVVQKAATSRKTLPGLRILAIALASI